MQGCRAGNFWWSTTGWIEAAAGACSPGADNGTRKEHQQIEKCWRLKKKKK